MGLALFIVAIVVALVSLGLIVFGRPREQRYGPSTPDLRPIGAGVLLVGLLFLFLASSTVVGTRTVGIETSFGKTVGVMQPGFHLKRPWANVNDWDGSLQTFKQDVNVRLANQTTSAVDVSVQWKLDPNADVLELYKSYKSFDKIEENVVARQVSRSLNDVFGTYDPLSVDAEGHAKVIVSDLANQVTRDMAGELPAGIAVVNVTIVKITFDGSVQQQINNIINAAAATKVAQQQQLTNEAISKANKALTDSGSQLTPGVLYQNCLNITQAALKAGESLPVGWTCGNPLQMTVPVK